MVPVERHGWVTVPRMRLASLGPPGGKGVSREVTIGVSLEALLCLSTLLKFSLNYELKLLPAIEIFLKDAFSFAYKSCICQNRTRK